MSNENQSRIIGPGLLGAVIGGAIGFYAFLWITRQGYYALALPGGLLGLGAGLCARGRSMALATICGVAALILGLYAEWRFAPFTANTSLGYFVAHIGSLQPMTLVMIALGAILGFRLALGRSPAKAS